jgi:hypothetical protein
MVRNKLIFLLVLMSAPFSVFSKLDMGRFEDAIEASDLENLQAQVRKMDRLEMPSGERKKIVTKLHQLATDITEEKRSIHILGNKKDMAQSGLGSLGVVAGLVALAVEKNVFPDSWLPHSRSAIHRAFNSAFSDQAAPDLANEMVETNDNAIRGVRIIGGLSLLVGGYIAYRGLTCTTQKGILANAEKVEQYLAELLSGKPEEPKVVEPINSKKSGS